MNTTASTAIVFKQPPDNMLENLLAEAKQKKKQRKHDDFDFYGDDCETDAAAATGVSEDPKAATRLSKGTQLAQNCRRPPKQKQQQELIT